MKLGDFGISKEIDHTLDKASTCVGTPCYLSPELCQDIPYSFKSDIWALGCLVFEMLALKPAFDAANLVSLFHKIVNCKFSALPVTCSNSAKDLVARILTRVPEERPTASEILNLPILQKYLSCVRMRSPELTLAQVHGKTSASVEEDRGFKLDNLNALMHSSGDVLPSRSSDVDSKRSISVHGEYASVTCDDLDADRPQSCPHSAVSRNLMLSACETVATWSGYGERGTDDDDHHHHLNKHNDQKNNKKVSPSKMPYPSDSESDSDLDPIPTQR